MKFSKYRCRINNAKTKNQPYFISSVSAGNGCECTRNFTHHEMNNLQALESIPAFPSISLDFGQVFTEASDVFRNVLGKMLGKKRILGINHSDWYW